MVGRRNRRRGVRGSRPRLTVVSAKAFMRRQRRCSSSGSTSYIPSINSTGHCRNGIPLLARRWVLFWCIVVALLFTSCKRGFHTACKNASIVMISDTKKLHTKTDCSMHVFCKRAASRTHGLECDTRCLLVSCSSFMRTLEL